MDKNKPLTKFNWFKPKEKTEPTSAPSDKPIKKPKVVNIGSEIPKRIFLGCLRLDENVYELLLEKFGTRAYLKHVIFIFFLKIKK